ncbi:hypothetical protein ACFXD5_30930 [Streptomyces sp. NPDC059385]|uniref:hypothetical protein n=1 Tax=Streptomyces sp. NPDC059385 TaxID=3346817 RepID=UPI0036C6802A
MKRQVKKAVVLVGMLMAVVLGCLGQVGSPAAGTGTGVAEAGSENHAIALTEIGWP